MGKIVIFDDDEAILNSISNIFAYKGIDRDQIVKLTSWEAFLESQYLKDGIEISVLFLDHVMSPSPTFGDVVYSELREMGLIDETTFVCGTSEFTQPYIKGEMGFDRSKDSKQIRKSVEEAIDYLNSELSNEITNKLN